MAIRKLSLDDFLEEEQFALIGIHCTIEDYRLAYLVNQILDSKLQRSITDVCNPSQKSTYSIFDWYDEKQFTTYNLVSNACKIQSVASTQPNSLFGENSLNTLTHYLIPEYKKVNYLLKIDTELNTNKEKIILNKILKIPQVVTAYSIDTATLKSKDNLIFN